MAIEADVDVIGGGLAGATAALAAARTGASVRLLSAAESTFRQASGLIDVLGSDPNGGLLADPFDAIPRLPADHPYARVGREAVREGLSLFDEIAPEYRGAHTDRNALVATHGGTVKPTARYPEAVAAGLASDRREALFVGFESIPDFDAPLAAAHLAGAEVPFEPRGVTIEFPGPRRADAAVTRYARALDADEAGADGRPVRTALADAVSPHVGGVARVGFPALLGVEAPAAVRAGLAAELGTDVFEVPMGPPSLPGRRLESTLYGALEDAGVRVATGNPVVDFAAANGRIETVSVDREGARVPHAATTFVLATGGLVGTGIESDRTAVREPVFGCHVSHPGDRIDWSDDDPFGDHAFPRFGVAVDAGCRPLDAGGDPEFANLRAAGAVIGGADFAAEKSGSGVSLATGYVAGTRAGEGA